MDGQRPQKDQSTSVCDKFCDATISRRNTSSDSINANSYHLREEIHVTNIQTFPLVYRLVD